MNAAPKVIMEDVDIAALNFTFNSSFQEPSPRGNIIVTTRETHRLLVSEERTLDLFPNTTVAYRLAKSSWKGGSDFTPGGCDPPAPPNVVVINCMDCKGKTLEDCAQKLVNPCGNLDGGCQACVGSCPGRDTSSESTCHCGNHCCCQPCPTCQPPCCHSPQCQQSPSSDPSSSSQSTCHSSDEKYRNSCDQSPPTLGNSKDRVGQNSGQRRKGLQRSSDRLRSKARSPSPCPQSSPSNACTSESTPSSRPLRSSCGSSASSKNSSSTVGPVPRMASPRPADFRPCARRSCSSASSSSGSSRKGRG
ncbi:hypothetical protein M8J76_010613 [Diaphorina citri]|nr:hypothetical protein M8J76_010613 [Diaphorina citri]